MAKLKGKGTILQAEFTPSTYTTIAQRVEIGGPSMTVETADSTDLDSSSREHVPTLTDNGELTCTIHYDPDNSTHSGLTDLIKTPATIGWKLTLTDDTPTTYSFQGTLTSFEPGGFTSEDIVSADITVKISGDITIT